MNVLELESQATNTLVAEDTTYCPRHPTVATQMRCNKCGKLICLKCGVQTPVGYRCRECVYQQQNVYFNAKARDNGVALLVTFVVAVIATPIVAAIGDSFYFGAFYLAFLAGPGAGALLAQLVRMAVGRRRSRQMRHFVLAGLVVGVLLGLPVAFLLGNFFVLANLPLWIFVGMATTTAYQMLR